MALVFKRAAPISVPAINAATNRRLNFDRAILEGYLDIGRLSVSRNSNFTLETSLLRFLYRPSVVTLALRVNVPFVP